MTAEKGKLWTEEQAQKVLVFRKTEKSQKKQLKSQKLNILFLSFENHTDTLS